MMERQEIKEDELFAMKIWLYQKMERLSNTRNIVEKGMLSAYEDCVNMIDMLIRDRGSEQG